LALFCRDDIYRHLVRQNNRNDNQGEKMNIIALCNQKGGVGKSTLTIHLAGEMARNNLRVLCIDLDPQGNSSGFFVKDIYSVPITIRSILIYNYPFRRQFNEDQYV
jgi:chromosome partitioning protein